MKKILILSLFVITSNVSALFDDKTIEPFLGPYKIKDNKTNNCPKKLMLMALCTLGQLDLKDPENLDFDFMSFKGINEGRMITSIEGVEVANSNSIFKDLKLTSNSNSYHKRFNKWLEIEAKMTLSKGRIHLVRSQKNDKAFKKNLECVYDFDEAANAKIMATF